MTSRPDPHPSTRRRESEAAETVDGGELSDRPNKKRKRVASPPWQFGTVEATTIKTADGRRVSARFNPNTPAMSESESLGRGRSVSQSMVRSRPPSPPWKRFEAEGPTSLQVDGVRKSGRMNKELTDVPKRTSPRQKKQTEKVKEENKVSVRPISRGKVPQVDGAPDARPQGGASMKRSLSPASRIVELKAQIAALQPTRSFQSPEAEPKPTKAAHMHKRKRSDDAPPLSQRPASPTSNRKSNKLPHTALSPTLARPSPKIKLRFSSKSKGLVVPDQHPHSVFPPPTKPPSLSIYQVLESYELQELQLPYVESERAPPSANDFRLKDQRLALEEADMRKKIRKAAKRGGVLSEGKSTLLEEEIEPQAETWKQYGHIDHLAAHAEFLWTLQKREKDQHRALAKKVAKEAVERWRVMRGPTEDEIQAEEDRVFGLIYKQVVLDMRGKWEMVSAHVGQLRKARWEAEEDARRQERLERQLEQAEDMVAQQRRRDDGSGVDTNEGSSSGDESSDGDDERGEENMIDSGSEAGSGMEDDEPADMPEDDLAGYLLARNAEPRDRVTLDLDEGNAGEDPGKQTSAAAADDDMQDVRDSNADATFSPESNTPAAAAATLETRLTTVPDGSAYDYSQPTIHHHQRDKVASEIAVVTGSDDEEGEEEQDDYLPDANGETTRMSVVTETELHAEHDITVPRSRARDLLSGDLDTAEPAFDLSDDESEDMVDSDEEMSSSDEDEELDNEASEIERSDDDEEEEAQSSMLGFLLKKKEIKSALVLPTPSTSAGGDEHDHTAEPASDDNADAQASTAKLEIEYEADVEPDVQAAEMTPPVDTEVAGSPQPVDSLAPDFAARSPSAETSYAMEISPIEPFAVKESLVRKMLGGGTNGVPNGLMVTTREMRKRGGLRRSKQLTATSLLRRQLQELEQIDTPELDLGSLADSGVLQRLRRRERKMQQLRDCIQITEASLCDGPVYGQDLRAMLTVKTGRPYQFSARARQPNSSSGQMRAWPALGQRPFQYEHLSDWYISRGSSLQRDVQNFDRYAEILHDTITRFAFCTPVATAPILAQAITPQSQQLLRASPAYPSTSDFAHEARSRTSIVFPDSRLLVYDSGKLQRLAKLLRELQAKGSRSLIFSQMICTLDILERFLNLLGLPYLRLDGATSLERRMIYSSEFNRPDSKYQCMILSSRAGGVGLNLTGASSVIFYDLDWNPQMDRQCMDRAHRIGQVRDVEVYKMVSEKTVEENILRRATQKSMLDQAVIQEGHFTTEYEIPARRADVEEEQDDDGKQIDTAVDRLFSGGEKAANQAIASVEDREDVLAAEAARKEENQDTEDFAEPKGTSAAPATPGPGVYLEGEEGDRAGRGHVDGYMVELMETMLKDVPFVPPVVRRVDKHGRDPSHRKRK
ncbi:swr1 complex component [Friedmanniomyces endolithicus]|uniref:Swr1 complex component n=1 Tax=Rachicladosporium monterosium TaxID=1507873 RepID=A0ABR0L326_9PEZI|nr:swr1 complex component [Friedmanniomyces endolithicus]KAK5142723.1 swr1 complex component [Rachicladosporium monterosium]